MYVAINKKNRQKLDIPRKTSRDGSITFLQKKKQKSNAVQYEWMSLVFFIIFSLLLQEDNALLDGVFFITVFFTPFVRVLLSYFFRLGLYGNIQIRLKWNWIRPCDSILIGWFGCQGVDEDRFMFGARKAIDFRMFALLKQLTLLWFDIYVCFFLLLLVLLLFFFRSARQRVLSMIW